jgi:hypothetical protein
MRENLVARGWRYNNHIVDLYEVAMVQTKSGFGQQEITFVLKSGVRQLVFIDGSDSKRGKEICQSALDAFEAHLA